MTKKHSEAGQTMQYALIHGIRSMAVKKANGICPICSDPVIAKCGPRIIHHWAHKGRRDCDPWWENETEWHRSWKNLFSEECREISHTAPNGEIHRADIKTPSGIYIEVQHSSMTDEERISRENFYQNLIWIIDGSVFLKNFSLYHMLPNPTSELGRDLVWAKTKRSLAGTHQGLCSSITANRAYQPAVTKRTFQGGLLEKPHKIMPKVAADYFGHHQYDWVRPRKTWLDASCPVYIDFGQDILFKLELYDETGLPCVRVISKKIFLSEVTTQSDARIIAENIYPI